MYFVPKRFLITFAILTEEVPSKTGCKLDSPKKLLGRTFLQNLYGFGEIRKRDLCFDAFIFINTLEELTSSFKAWLKKILIISLNTE